MGQWDSSKAFTRWGIPSKEDVIKVIGHPNCRQDLLMQRRRDCRSIEQFHVDQKPSFFWIISNEPFVSGDEK